MTGAGRSAARLTAVALVVSSSGGHAFAQALERHVAPGLQAAPAPRVGPAPPSVNEDSRPLGPDLTRVVLIGATDDLPPMSSAVGVDASRLGSRDALPLARALRRFLGRPISRKLISELDATVVRHYRHTGRPFVAVSAPPQEITERQLVLRVIEFRLGRKTAVGASRRLDRAVERDVRIQPGDQIDAPELSQDLEWLNRSPLHQVTASFSPGEALGQTDLTLHVHAEKPWTVSAGYADDGTPSSGLGRWFLIGEVGDLLVPGSLLSYEGTTSDDFWYARRKVFADVGHPKYLSHSVVAALPLAPRFDLTVTADWIESDTAGPVFSSGQETAETSALLRTALSNFLPLPGDLVFGGEARWQRTDEFFGAFKIRHATAGVAQGVLGWRDVWSSPGVTQSLALNFRLSPGGAFGDDSDPSFRLFSQGRVGSARYTYGDLDYAGSFALPARWSYSTNLHLQVAGQPLLDTEQMAIGGDIGARTYVYDDGSYDAGVVWRNELHAPPFAALKPGEAPPIALGPFAFADLAEGVDIRGPKQSAASVGGGFDVSIGAHLAGRIAAGWSLVDAPFTRAGDFKLLARLAASF